MPFSSKVTFPKASPETFPELVGCFVNRVVQAVASNGFSPAGMPKGGW